MNIASSPATQLIALHLFVIVTIIITDFREFVYIVLYLFENITNAHN